MHAARSTPVRFFAGVVAISFGLCFAACEKDGASTTPPDGDAAAPEQPEAPAEPDEEAGGW